MSSPCCPFKGVASHIGNLLALPWAFLCVLGGLTRHGSRPLELGLQVPLEGSRSFRHAYVLLCRSIPAQSSTASMPGATPPQSASASVPGTTGRIAPGAQTQLEVLYARGPVSNIPEQFVSRKERFLELDDLQPGWTVELLGRNGVSTVDARFYSPSGEAAACKEPWVVHVILKGSSCMFSSTHASFRDTSVQSSFHSEFWKTFGQAMYARARLWKRDIAPCHARNFACMDDCVYHGLRSFCDDRGGPLSKYLSYAGDEVGASANARRAALSSRKAALAAAS
jgi:hypothetical protein